MKIGIFDSGLGGLLMTKAITKHLPDIDVVYFGDTLHLPYGNRSTDTIYEYSRRAVDFLFEHDCALIITACNTVSASALRRLQNEYLPNGPYADRRILGVVVPTLEQAAESGYKNIGLIGTNYTVSSNVYLEELDKIDPVITLHQIATPLLVPLIENKGEQWLYDVLEHYLTPLKQQEIECLILGCTHYPYLKTQITDILGKAVDVFGQDDIVPLKLEDYLKRHPEIDCKLTRNGGVEFLVSDITDGYIHAAQRLYNEDIEIEHVPFVVSENKYIKENDYDSANARCRILGLGRYAG